MGNDPRKPEKAKCQGECKSAAELLAKELREMPGGTWPLLPLTLGTCDLPLGMLVTT